MSCNKCLLRCSWVLLAALIVTVFAHVRRPATQNEPFNYDLNTLDWLIRYPQCRGYKQSPIALLRSQSIVVNIPAVFLLNYNTPFNSSLRLENNGHTVEFQVPHTFKKGKPLIAGGILNGNYEADSVHFHWGSSTRKGTEHMLNGRFYDLEMHIVHHNTKYPDMATASNYPDGLAVVAVLFQSVSNRYYSIPALNAITENLRYVRRFNSTVNTGQYISLDQLMSYVDRNNFYTYYGSLTTPPCSEVVTWIIYTTVLPIHHKALRKFWRIRDQRGFRYQNTRPLQANTLHTVYRRKNPLNTHWKFFL